MRESDFYGTNQDQLLFLEVRRCMIKMCNEHSDIIEYQLFKARLENATSFDDLFKNI